MIRKYQIQDKNRLVEILRLNTPSYFDPSEEEEFLSYLNSELEDYYVITDNDQIVGSGGINYGFEGGKAARISWDLVHPHYQGKGIGSTLTQYRISQLKKRPEINQIIVRTSQLVYPFYEKNGFVLERIVPDYWAKDYDLYLMKLKVSD